MQCTPASAHQPAASTTDREFALIWEQTHSAAVANRSAPKFLLTVAIHSNDAGCHRLTELGIKATFTEDLFEQLIQVAIRQQQQIDTLAREVERLRQQMVDAGSVGLRRAGDDLPPHY